MTTPEHPSPAPQPSPPASPDRIYRSPLGIVGGVLLLGIVCWLGVDAIVVGHGNTPWLALALLILALPAIAAFTLRPAVFANDHRLRVRNPLRVVALPWGQVEMLRSGFTNEVTSSSGTTYQLWAVPVSLRARKQAARRQARIESDQRRGGKRRGGGLFGPTPVSVPGGPEAEAEGPVRAEGDRIMDELKDLHEARAKAATSQGEVTVRWAYEVIAPVAVGVLLLVIALAVG
ncbi:PH domain-containing protein [Streptomyces actuosus]|uniref:PH domain-containing protein n=1 Tax=Streptomyces actuosus TaxID=1885 RepID=A0ABS2VMU5_STRAS|nr:PH domain-containing protein [Streptomyces actuosus]MBN0044427.1 PH domain-containing protein [Streptomyces actuosus]